MTRTPKLHPRGDPHPLPEVAPGARRPGLEGGTWLQCAPVGGTWDSRGLWAGPGRRKWRGGGAEAGRRDWVWEVTPEPRQTALWAPDRQDLYSPHPQGLKTLTNANGCPP